MSNPIPETPSSEYSKNRQYSKWDDTQNLGINYGPINVVSKYKWTLSKNFDSNSADSMDEVPIVHLREYEVDESTIKTQIDFYTTALKNLGKGGMAPYEQLFPRKRTGNEYIFPYFSEVNFEVNTPVWSSLDQLEQGGKALESAAGTLFGKQAAAVTAGVIQAAAGIGGATLASIYPKVGIMDRPRLWQNHEFRTINIKFPLFNIMDVKDWEQNRSLCWTLVNSNLFYKRDFITGIPPVYYEVLVPGQHYSYASCVTNLTIYNRGNMRKLKYGNGRKEAVVPDAYEVNMTLTDMVMPSRNLFAQATEPLVTTN
jgi:hypothetical protein